MVRSLCLSQTTDPGEDEMADRPQHNRDFEATQQFSRDEKSTSPAPQEPTSAAGASGSPSGLPGVKGFDVQSELGRGGNGVVYRAFDKRLKRLVALKMLRSGLDASEEQSARFRTEAESVARLQHAGIVQIYDVGEHEGLPYLTLEFVDGTDLTAFSGHQPLVPQVAAAIVRSVAQAIGFAHENEVIHRDLKPGNILIPNPYSVGGGSGSSTHAISGGTVTNEPSGAASVQTASASSGSGRLERAEMERLLRVAGKAKVADFGLAKLLDADDGYTRTGNVLGTATYMSPEQASAKDDVGPATDIYSLGAILYFLLTGSVPFRGATLIQTLRMVISTEAIAPRRHIPELDADIDTICLKCLQKEPGRRYESAYALADDLTRYLDGQPIQARPLGRFEQSVRWLRRKPAVAALLALVLFLAIAGPATALYQMQLSRDLQSAKAERDRADEQKLSARVESLLTTALRNFPDQLDALSDDQPQVNEKLANVWQQPDLPDESRLRVAMALSGIIPAAHEYLESRLMGLSETEFLVAMRLIESQCEHDRMAADRWKTFARQLLNSQQINEAERGYASCLLSQLDARQVQPEHTHGVSRWLCRKAEPNLSQFTRLLAPLGSQIVPTAQTLFRTAPDQVERNGAAGVLAVYLREEPSAVAELFLSADPGQFRVLRIQIGARLSEYRDPFAAALSAQPKEDDPQKTEIDRRRANAGVGLILSGEPKAAWPYLKHSADPELRTYLIHRFAELGVEPSELIAALREHTDLTIHRALVHALGEYPVGVFSPRDMDNLVTQLTSLNLSDPGLRGAVKWTLTQFDRADQLPPLPRVVGMDAASTTEPIWQASNGLDMVAIPAYRGFHAGSPRHERSRVSTNETYRPLRIERTFAISTTEVTHRMFEEFLADHPTLRHIGPESFQIQPNYPESRLAWYRAIAFCHWLNRKEGIPESEWCFHPNLKGDFHHDMELTWDALDRCGYRLPTEAEWEFACRAGAETSRFYGSGRDLLSRYAWYSTHSDGRTHDVAELKPNDFGLFDMLGNISEYTFDTAPSHNRRSMSDEQKMFNSSILRPQVNVSSRGGSQYSGADAVRSAVRFSSSPTFTHHEHGFRIARTIHNPRDIEAVKGRLIRDPNNLQLRGRYLRLLCRDGRTTEARAEYQELLADACKEEEGIVLTGNGDCLEFAQIPFDEFEQFTVEAWVRDWKGVIFNQGRYWDPENSIWINLPDHAGWESDKGLDHYFLKAPLVVDNEWTHLALVFDGSARRVFRNGEQISSDEQEDVGPFLKNRAFQIGALRGRFDVGQGVLGAFRVSKVARYTRDFTPSRELTDDDDTQLFVHPSQIRGNTVVNSVEQAIGRFVHAPWIADVESNGAGP